jgi:hypothetical protein
MKVVIHGSRTKQNLPGTLALKMRGRLNVYEIPSRGNSFTPEMSRDKRRYHRSTSCLSYMVMLTPGNTILSMSTWKRELRREKGTPQKKETHERQQKYIFPRESGQETRIALEN